MKRPYFSRFLKHCRLIWDFTRASFVADLEYRLNYLVRFITDIVWYLAQISVFEVLFRQTTNLSGWDLPKMRVFLGVLFVLDASWMFLFSENLDHLSEKVRKGDLDLLLSKPVNSQFMMSFQKFATAYLANWAIAFSFLVWSLVRLEQPLTFTHVITLAIMIPCALAITYSIRFYFAASALFLTRAENIGYLWFHFYKLGMRPDSIYPPWLRYVVLSLVPVGFIASVPTRIALGEADFGYILGGLSLAAIFLYSTTLYWKKGLKSYVSASS